MSRHHILLRHKYHEQKYDVYTAEDFDNYQSGYSFPLAEVRVQSDLSDAEILPLEGWEGYPTVKSVAELRKKISQGHEINSVIPFGGRSFINLLTEINRLLDGKQNR
jgi:hypothetical protein